jgi:hypothetical protein
MSGKRYFRRVIQVTAEDSPNVRYARWQEANGITPTDEVILPGVLTWGQFQAHLRMWDEIKQAIGLYGRFWDGAELLLFPPQWLDRAQTAALFDTLKSIKRQAEGIGIDPAEGGDKTTMCAVDRYGVLEVVSKKTPNTAIITSEAVAFIGKHNCPYDRVVFDRGGGGLQHVQRLKQDHDIKVRSVGFGEAPHLPLKRGLYPFDQRQEVQEDRVAYLNLRAQMAHELSMLFDPSLGWNDGLGFFLPPWMIELRRQLALMPRWTTEEGKIYLPPKKRKTGDKEGKTAKVTLEQIIGHSPDEFDALCLSVHGMLHKAPKAKAGVA